MELKQIMKVRALLAQVLKGSKNRPWLIHWWKNMWRMSTEWWRHGNGGVSYLSVIPIRANPTIRKTHCHSNPYLSFSLSLSLCAPPLSGYCILLYIIQIICVQSTLHLLSIHSSSTLHPLSIYSRANSMGSQNGVPKEQAPSIEVMSLSYAFQDGSSGLQDVVLSLSPGSRTLLIGGISSLSCLLIQSLTPSLTSSSEWRW